MLSCLLGFCFLGEQIKGNFEENRIDLI